MRVFGFILFIGLIFAASYYLTINGTDISSLTEWLLERTAYELFLLAIVFLLLTNLLLDYWRNLGPVEVPSYLKFWKKGEKSEEKESRGLAVIDMVNVSLMVAITVLLLLVYLDGSLAQN